jgi:hypothetical protein
MRIQRYLTLGVAWLSLGACCGAFAGDRVLAAATDPLGNMNRLPAALEQTVGQLRTSLEADGFAVARGYWTLWGAEDCKYPLQVLGYCYGNNPTAPYVLAMVPTWKDEYVDQTFHHLINQPLRNMTAIHRMDQREALVIVAQLPPPARYFGIGTSVFTREAAINREDPIYRMMLANPTFSDPLLLNILFGVSPDPSRRMLVSSIGNSTNNAVIEDQVGKAPWNRPFYNVITSDGDLEAKITDALVEAGASRSDIFTEPVAPGLVKLGLDRSADDLFTYIRYAMSDDKTMGDEWRQQLPLTILRVRDLSTRQYNNPLPIPILTPRVANFDETKMADDFGRLQAAVRATWEQSESEAPLIPFISMYKFLDLVGQHCLGYGYPDAQVTRGPMDCLGDSNDGDYQFSLSGKLDENKVVALIGTLPKETGNSTYTSLSVNWFPELVGLENIDDNDLKGTAAAFASVLKDYPDDKFYVYYVARDCTGLVHCREISTKLMPSGAFVKFIERNYVTPGLTTAPDPNLILSPVAIMFDGKNRPLMQ